MPRNWYCFLSAIPIVTLSIHAQEDSLNSEDVLELSPFVVEASDDVGYTATSSLAGSRLKTDLSDIASQVDVFTLEFADDLGAVSIEDLYEYSTSMENSRDFTANPNGGVNAPNTSRVRGFDNATQSSDFFKSNIGSDLYNIDRVTVANGPNSILFGLGLPGGIVNTRMKVASFSDHYSLQFQVDNWNGFRANVDLNKELVKDKLAVRVAALERQSRTFRDSEFDDQRRYYVTATYRPFKNTTLRMKYETIDRSVAKATNYITQDFVSPWYEAGKPLFDNSVGASNGGVGNSSINNNNDPYYRRNNNALSVIQYGAVDSIEARPWSGTAITKGPHEIPGATITEGLSLRNFDIFPADVDPRVGGRLNEIDGNIFRMFWEQRITDDLHFELAYSKEKREELRGGMFQLQESLNLRGDPNMYLNDGVTPNPNAGKLYIESYPQVIQALNELEELRLTVSYELDFRDKKGFLSYLGRHRFAGLMSKYWQYDVSQTHRGIVTGGNALEEGTYVRNRFYLDRDNGIEVADHLYGSPFGPWVVMDPTSGQTMTVSTWDNPNGAFQSTRLVDTEVDSKMIAVQSFFIDDRVNVFYGLRSDDFEIKGPEGDSIAQLDNGLFPSMDDVKTASEALLTGGEETETLGVVARPLSWLSFHYNESDNYQVPNGKVDAYGHSIPGIASEGDDWGVRFDFRSGKNSFSIRLNRFTDSQLYNQSALSLELRDLAAHVERTLRDPSLTSTYGDNYTTPDAYYFLKDIGESENLYADYTRKSSEGTEIVGTGNFGKNIRLRLAIGEQDTLVYDRAAIFRKWVGERLPVWQDAGGLGWENIIVDEDGTRTIEEYYNDIIVPEISKLENVDGLPRFRQRRWRANLFANYTFTEGSLKGFDAGVGIRWRDRAMIRGVALGDQQYAKQYSPQQCYFDLAFGYSKKIQVGSQKLDWNIRLNVKDLALHDKIYGIRGSEGLIEIVDSAYDVKPTFLLTNTFRF